MTGPCYFSLEIKSEIFPAVQWPPRPIWQCEVRLTCELSELKLFIRAAAGNVKLGRSDVVCRKVQ